MSVTSQQAILQSHGSLSTLTGSGSAGTSFVNLTAVRCNEVTIVNETGASLDILCFGSDPADFITISSPSGLTIPISGNAQELGVRCTDQRATQVRVRFLWRTWLH